MSLECCQGWEDEAWSLAAAFDLLKCCQAASVWGAALSSVVPESRSVASEGTLREPEPTSHEEEGL